MTKTLSTVKTRRALAADAEDIAGLLAVLGYPANTMEVTARMERFDQSDTSILIVAEIGERIVGVASGQLVPSIHDSALVGQLTGLVVDTAFQKRGVGAALTEVVENWVSENGAARITLTSASHREGAHAFYEGLGYKRTGVRLAKSLPGARS